MTPKLIINNFDYAPYIQEMNITINDLDADGSGRNILDGLMYRTRIARKMKLDVKLLPITEQIMYQVAGDLNGTYTEVTYLNPSNNQETTGTFYCSSIQFGSQMYHPSEIDEETGVGTTWYTDGSFSLTER